MTTLFAESMMACSLVSPSPGDDSLRESGHGDERQRYLLPPPPWALPKFTCDPTHSWTERLLRRP